MTIFYRDRQPRTFDMAAVTTTTIDFEAKRRTLALQDARDHVRRAASATAAATAGDDDTTRSGMLSDARRRLLLVLRELEALA
jgi:hypothetical protein